jgi:signal transduction histidine kinase
MHAQQFETILMSATHEFKRSYENDKLQLLAGASELIVNCLDYRATLEKVAALVVSNLATWCTIDLLNEDQKIERVAAAHRDDGKLKLVQQLAENYPASPSAKRGVYRVIETGKSILIPHVSSETWSERADSSEHLKLIMELGSSSYMCLPLIARGRIVGAAMLLADDRVYDAQDLKLAEELMALFAMAFDNVNMFRKMQKAIQDRDEFLSIATHEIRNPLTPMMLHLSKIEDILTDSPLTEEKAQIVKKSISVFHRQADRLIHFFNKILNLSEIDSNRLQLEWVETDFAKLIQDVCARFDYQVGGLTSVIHFANRCTSQCRGLCDPERMEQVVCNLLSNAIKYGDGKPIEVQLTYENSQAALQVTDHGIGIAPGDLARIFDRYQRVETDRRTQGVGLGLHIAQKIVQAHGGEISVKSELKTGSTFLVRLPCVPKKKKI